MKYINDNKRSTTSPPPRLWCRGVVSQCSGSEDIGLAGEVQINVFAARGLGGGRNWDGIFSQILFRLETFRLAARNFSVRGFGWGTRTAVVGIYFFVCVRVCVVLFPTFFFGFEWQQETDSLGARVLLVFSTRLVDRPFFFFFFTARLCLWLVFFLASFLPSLFLTLPQPCLDTTLKYFLHG